MLIGGKSTYLKEAESVLPEVVISPKVVLFFKETHREELSLIGKFPQPQKGNKFSFGVNDSR